MERSRLLVTDAAELPPRQATGSLIMTLGRKFNMIKPAKSAQQRVIGSNVSKTYIVHRKKGAPLSYIASHYIEDKKAGKIFFLNGNEEKRERFVLLEDVSGIDIELPKNTLSRAEMLQQLKDGGINLEGLLDKWINPRDANNTKK
jgi:hypothetical protein